MTNAFVSLSALVRAFFALWALLLCLSALVGAVQAVVKRRYLFLALALVLFAPVYVMWQVIFDLSLSATMGGMASLTHMLVSLHRGWWLGAFVLLTLAAGMLLGFFARHAASIVTPDAVKSYLDQIPCGVCCWRDNGRVLFANVCMNDLCVALTDAPLMNGNQFRQAVSAEIMTIGERMWRFSCRDVAMGGEPLHEMIAVDITAEYAKTQALERDKAELARINRELTAYNLSIDDIIRRQEILQAKVNIHDEMNRLMLSTVAAENAEAVELDRIFALWQQNALLLCLEAEKTADSQAMTRLRALADALKMQLEWQGSLPATLSDSGRNLFFLAAQEAIANAAKHADARRMVITVAHTDSGLSCRFSNDGTLPQGVVTFAGGLANLARLAEQVGATVTVSTEGAFALVLNFCQNAPNGGCNA